MTKKKKQILARTLAKMWFGECYGIARVTNFYKNGKKCDWIEVLDGYYKDFDFGHNPHCFSGETIQQVIADKTERCKYEVHIH